MNYLYVTKKQISKFDFKEINPREFFPIVKLHRYDWRNPRFKVTQHKGQYCLAVTIDNLTCDDPICDCFESSATAYWAIQGQRIELVGMDAVDQSGGEISPGAAMRLGNKTQTPVTVSYVYRGLSAKKTAVVVPGGTDEIRLVGGSPVDTWITASAVRKVVINA
jgi:hypothetical protein